jgi:hypothetical protein
LKLSDHRNAARTARLQLRALPVGKLRDSAQHTGMARLLAHQFKAALDRVLACRFEQLIDKRFDGITGVGMPHRTPPQDRHTDIDLMQVAFEVRDIVGNFVRAFIGCRVEAVLHGHRLKGRTLHDGLTDNGVAPGLNLAVAHHSAHAVNAERTIVSPAHVVFAGPDQLERLAGTDGFCDFRKLGGDMHRLLRTPSKAATSQNGLERNLSIGTPRILEMVA